MSEHNDNSNKKHSGGPKTPEGKKRSSLNSIRHGCTADMIVLPQEDREKFQELLDDYVHHYGPGSKLGLDLVHELAATRWRLQRIWNVETSAVAAAVISVSPTVSQRYSDPSPDLFVAAAYQDLAEKSKTLSLLHRYETRLSRRFHQILIELDRLQQNRRAEEQRLLDQKKAAEHRQQPQITENPGDPGTCRVLLTIPKSLLRNELSKPVPIDRRDPKIQPKEDDAA